MAAVEENILDDLLHQNHEDDPLFDEDDKKTKRDDDQIDDGEEDKIDEKDGDHSDISTDDESRHDKDGSESGSLSDEDIDEDRRLADKASKSGNGKEDKPDTAKVDTRLEGQKDENKDNARDDEKSTSEDEKSGESEDERKVDIKSEVNTKESDKQSNASTSQNVKKKKGKSYDYATKLNYLFRDARFFLVKSNNAENVTLSKAKGVWSTPPTNESRLNKAFEESRNVLLIFSIKESGKFSGFARLATESRHDVPQVSWVLPPGLSARALGGVLKIDWICRKDLPFQKVQHLYNPWNDGKPIKIGRDGQEIEPKVAEELCRLFSVDENVDMTPILRKSKESARNQRAKPLSERKPISGPGSRGPISGSRDRFPGPPGGGRGGYRKRRYEDGGQGVHHSPHYGKYGRYSEYQQTPYGHHSRGYSSAGRSSSGSGGVRSYEEYLRNTRYANDYPNGGSGQPQQYYSRSYQERGYYPDYPREPGFVNYDRRVDEFLKHTSSSGGSAREYDRRYRERR